MIVLTLWSCPLSLHLLFLNSLGCLIEVNFCEIICPVSLKFTGKQFICELTDDLAWLKSHWCQVIRRLWVAALPHKMLTLIQGGYVLPIEGKILLSFGLSILFVDANCYLWCRPCHVLVILDWLVFLATCIEWMCREGTLALLQYQRLLILDRAEPWVIENFIYRDWLLLDAMELTLFHSRVRIAELLVIDGVYERRRKRNWVESLVEHSCLVRLWRGDIALIRLLCLRHCLCWLALSSWNLRDKLTFFDSLFVLGFLWIRSYSIIFWVVLSFDRNVWSHAWMFLLSRYMADLLRVW